MQRIQNTTIETAPASSSAMLIQVQQKLGMVPNLYAAQAMLDQQLSGAVMLIGWPPPEAAAAQ
jgi:hypothetical protein